MMHRVGQTELILVLYQIQSRVKRIMESQEIRDWEYQVVNYMLNVEWGNTAALGMTQFNVFDTIDNICIKIMEWYW